MSITPLFSGEMMLLKAAWSTSTGSVVVFALANDDDLDVFKDMATKKGNRAGQRLAVVMVEIAADETAVQPDNPISVQAALLCKGEGFWRYCEHIQGYSFDNPHDREQQATAFLRAACMVNSRAQLDTDGTAAARFVLLRNCARNFAVERRRGR